MTSAEATILDPAATNAELQTVANACDRRRKRPASRPERTSSGRRGAVVLEASDRRIGEPMFVLDTDRLFPLFGLPPRLGA
jgi:hypothetical protein